MFKEGRSGLVCVCLVALMLISGCDKAREAEFTRAALLPFDENSEDAVVLFSVETIVEMPSEESLSWALFKWNEIDRTLSWDPMYDLIFVRYASDAKGQEKLSREITYVPDGHSSVDRSYGYRHENRFYFLFKTPPGKYYLEEHQYYTGREEFFKENNGDKKIVSLTFMAERGKVNYAGNLKMRWHPKDSRINIITGLTRDINEANRLLEERFSHIKGKIVDAQTPDSRIGPRIVYFSGITRAFK